MMLAMFAGENRDNLLLAVMMAYRSSVHESTLLNHPDGSAIDISSVTRDSVVTFLDTSNSLHPFFLHRLDVGPLCLCVQLLRRCLAGWSLPEGGWTDLRGYWSSLGTPGCCHVSNCVCGGFRLEVPSVLIDLESVHGLSPNVILACEPWGHMDHDGEGCECLYSDSTGAYKCS